MALSFSIPKKKKMAVSFSLKASLTFFSYFSAAKRSNNKKLGHRLRVTKTKLLEWRISLVREEMGSISLRISSSLSFHLRYLTSIYGAGGGAEGLGPCEVEAVVEEFAVGGGDKCGAMDSLGFDLGESEDESFNES